MSEDLKAEVERRYAASRDQVLQCIRDRLENEKMSLDDLVRLVFQESYWRGAIDAANVDLSKLE